MRQIWHLLSFNLSRSLWQKHGSLLNFPISIQINKTLKCIDFEYKCYSSNAFETASLNTKLSDNTLPSNADVVVIGGGIVGTSTAYHLAKRGVDVVLLERHKLTCGTTWHSAAMMNTLRGDIPESELMGHTRKLITTIEEETGVSPGWLKHGGLTITKNEKMMDEFRRMNTLSKYVKNESMIVSPNEIKELHPFLAAEKLVGGLYVPADGSVDPTGLANAYARGATQNGAKIVEDSPVNEIIVSQDNRGSKFIQGVICHKGKINCKHIILATGAWSKMVAEKIGVCIPLRVIKHNYVVTDIMPGISKYPNVRYTDGSVYLKVHNDTLFLGTFERNPTFVENLEPDLVFGLYDLDWDVFQPCMEHMIDVMPKLADTGYRTIINGPESFTPDYRPLFGEVPEINGLYLNCAMNSRGIQLSGGFGREMANLIVDGVTQIDMFGYNITRFQDSYVRNQKWLEETTHEAILRTYVVKPPTIQPFASRNLRKTPLHDYHEHNGAFFGVAGGWERPMFYIPELKDKLKVPENYDWYGYYGHAKRNDTSTYEKVHNSEYANWSYSKRVSGCIRKEVQNCRNECVIFDLTSFGKIRVKGSGALRALEWLCTAVMNKPINHATYTLTLNDRGGIENDFTVTRLAEDEFFIVTGASATKYVLTLLRKIKIAEDKSNDFVDLMISDETDAFGIVSIQGPKSRQLLASLIDQNNENIVSNENFIFATSKKLNLHLEDEVVVEDVLTLRMTFVGELGYELYLPLDRCYSLVKTLMNNKKGIAVELAGMEALASMSMEKNFKHWHGDIETTDNPLEAGLKFLCKLNTDVNFKGKKALRELVNVPLKKRLLGFTVDEPSVDLNGGEVIYRDGSRIVGYIKRSGYGYTINKHIGFGYVELETDERNVSSKETLRQILESKYEIEIMGKKVLAQPFVRAPYDSERRRILL